MTIQTRMPPRSRIAADGLPRRLFTVADVERMVEAGILDETERVELIEGELVPMSAKGIRHEVIKTELNLHLARHLPAAMLYSPETTFRLSVDTYLEPDFVVFPRRPGLAALTGPTALLVVEIAASSRSYDLGRKAKLYAGFGIRELWVIDAATLETHVHRDPSADGYRSVTVHPAEATVTPLLAPDLALRAADLDLRDGEGDRGEGEHADEPDADAG